MSEPQRYSGPELEPLLRKVRDELGEDAAIVEANKVRSGGVAGFFANEHYEVVADRRNAGSMAHDDDTMAGPAASPAPRVASASQPRAESVDGAVRNPSTGNASIQSALLERAEHVSTQEFLSRAAESDSISLGGDDFDSVLNHFLDAGTPQAQSQSPEPRRRKTDIQGQPLPNHRVDTGRVEPETRRSQAHHEPVGREAPGEELRQGEQAHDQLDQDQGRLERARQEQLRQEQLRREQLRREQLRQEQLRREQLRQEQLRREQVGHEPPPQLTTGVRDGRGDEAGEIESRRQQPVVGRRAGGPGLLWRYVLSARGWQCPTVAEARVAWFIGPYAAANSVERRFGPREPHDVMHLSPEQDLGPRWATTNSFDEALERCRRWRQLDVAGSIVVDYPADEFDLRLLGELSPDLCDAVHLVADNLDRMEAMIDLCHFAPVPVMVDLIQAPPSSEIAVALDAGLPIASILGMEVTPQLIVAIRLDAAHGEGG